MVDATEKGGFSRFINHSCMPNCRMEKWQVGKKYRLGLVAMRDIVVDEELTYDYACDDTG
jgi:histone-lysine N-methyltransferase SETD2